MKIERLYDYQEKKAQELLPVLKEKKLLLLFFDTRTGKTPISLRLAELYGAKKVLFVTKKKAFDGIRAFLHLFDMEVVIINYESLHKITDRDFDFAIIDESHSIGAYPKPALRTKRLRKIVYNLPMLLLSATPFAESMSQIYHQFWISKHSPFWKYRNFYVFAKYHVDVYERYVSGGRRAKMYNRIKDKKKFFKLIEPYVAIMKREEIGGYKDVIELKEYISLDQNIHRILYNLHEYKMDNINGQVYVADTPMALMHAYHQLSSGVLKIDNTYHILSYQKGYHIKRLWNDGFKKIAVFYLYKGEEKMLKEVFGDKITYSDKEFNESDDKVFIGHFKSASMGTNLSTADYIIFMNVPFSATEYLQAKDRGRVKDGQHIPQLIWLLSETGFEERVLKVVSQKIDYNLAIFKEQYGGINEQTQKSAYL